LLLRARGAADPRDGLRHALPLHARGRLPPARAPDRAGASQGHGGLMGRLSFKMPDIGEGVHEGEIVKWYVAPGSRVAEDDPLVEVMTDKATVTIASPTDARVVEVRVPARRVATVG